MLVPTHQESPSLAPAVLSRILVPVEFSPRCRGAAQYAKALACHFHSEVILMHAVVPHFVPYGPAEVAAYAAVADISADIAQQREASLQEFLSSEFQGVHARKVVLFKDPAIAIVEYASAAGCDLIVIPTHGYGPFRRLLLGSVTRQVLRDAPCPVCTGPHMEGTPASDSISFRKVLCAVDFAEDSRIALSWAASFARAFAADLAVVHAIPASTVHMEGVYFDPEWLHQVADTARERLAVLCDELHITAEILVETGDVPDAIATAAARSHANLLVVGRGQPTTLFGPLRANSYAIIRESPCPVVAV